MNLYHHLLHYKDQWVTNQMEFLLQTEIDLNGRTQRVQWFTLVQDCIETRDRCYHAIFN